MKLCAWSHDVRLIKSQKEMSDRRDEKSKCNSSQTKWIFAREKESETDAIFAAHEPPSFFMHNKIISFSLSTTHRR